MDPRCFEPIPENAPYLTARGLASASPARREELLRLAAEFALRNIEYRLEPVGRVSPEFKFAFTAPDGLAVRPDEEIVVLTGTWRTKVTAGISGWQVRSKAEKELSVVVSNSVDFIPHPRVAVLFPGEHGFVLDLAGVASREPAKPGPAAGKAADAFATFGSFFRQGFVHVVPKGLDHILFVLGIFLLSAAWRPLLYQVTAFTLAHTVTLGLATFGLVSVPASLVEPVIAASIVFVALENVFRPVYSFRRLATVFAFGLIHGLGFAGALGDIASATGSLGVALAGFNFGVEAGQLAVIAVAWALTFRLTDEQVRRRFVVIPASVLIALAGLYWAVERVLG
ncbi:MAG: HupE/UreJ family protein [Opitutales bacterium]